MDNNYILNISIIDAIGWTAIKYRVPFITTLSAAEAIVRGLRANQKSPHEYRCLQEFYDGR